MMAKRGIELTAVHFASPPYTSERAEMKVEALLRQVGAYAGRIRLHTVPFTHIQEEIGRACPEELFTLVMRRFYDEDATRVAKSEDCGALVTGRVSGQVASQTIPALACTDAAAGLPVFRPVIGMDKEEIIAIARKIGTFETSIQPVWRIAAPFSPRGIPRTKPPPRYVLRGGGGGFGRRSPHRGSRRRASAGRSYSGIPVIRVCSVPGQESPTVPPARRHRFWRFCMNAEIITVGTELLLGGYRQYQQPVPVP